MSSSDSKPQDSQSNSAATKTLDDQNPLEPQIDSKIVKEEKNPDDSGEGKEDEEEEEEGECGFCLFMKGGGCRDSFTAWEKCIEEAEKNKEDIVEKCFEITGVLKKCMEAHSDYYEPILKAEKAAEEEAIIELENEANANALKQDTNSRGMEENLGSANLDQREAASSGESEEKEKEN